MRNLEKDLRTIQGEKDKLQTEMEGYVEELQKRSEALDEKDVLLQNAWHAVDQANM